MSEIDLIPAAYRRQLAIGKWLRLSAMLTVLVSIAVVGATVFLGLRSDAIEGEIDRLQAEKAISTQQRAELEQLAARKAELTQRLELLAGLRGGSAAMQMFMTVDHAVNPGRVWFTDWRFRRAGTKTDVDPATVDAGYFIIVKSGPHEHEETWLIETAMKINGEALDHAALSEFVSELVDQPEIQSVRVVRTETVSVHQRALVRFSLDVLVATNSGATS